MNRAELLEFEQEIDSINEALDILDPDNNIEGQWIEIYSQRLDWIIHHLETEKVA